MVHLFIVQTTECAPLIYPTYCMPASLCTATAQLNKLIQTSELKFDLRYLNISYTKHVNNESLGRKPKQLLESIRERLIMVEEWKLFKGSLTTSQGQLDK